MKNVIIKILLLSCTLSLHAQDLKQLPRLETTPKRIAVFKNGLGFVIRSGQTKLENGLAEMDGLPSAALGALWISPQDASHRIAEVSTFRVKEKVPMEAVNLTELLRANIGEVVILSYATGGSPNLLTAEGEIVSVPVPRTAPSEPASPFRPWNPPALSAVETANLVVLKLARNGEFLALDKNAVHSVQWRGGERNTAMEKEVVRARVRFDEAPESAAVSMAYLQKGWNWSPSYLVNLLTETEAEINLEAVLANDIEDIEDAEVSFVVGYPNFAFADVVSPLAMQQTVAEFVQSLLMHSQAPRGQNRSIMMQNAVTYSHADMDSSFFSPALLAAGQSSEDLFFFEQHKVTLAKGARARYLLLKARCPYEHVYQWDVKEGTRPNGYSSEDPDRAAGKQNEVWHTLRLRNVTKEPWTSAPAFTMRSGMPVAQDTLKYTPPGARSNLRITVASDIRAEQLQTEIGREPVTVLGYQYYKVQVSNELELKNWKDKPVKLCINRTISGEVVDPGDATVTKTAREVNALNPSSELLWEFELGPGEEKRIKFTHSTLASR